MVEEDIEIEAGGTLALAASHRKRTRKSKPSVASAESQLQPIRTASLLGPGVRESRPRQRRQTEPFSPDTQVRASRARNGARKNTLSSGPLTGQGRRTGTGGSGRKKRVQPDSRRVADGKERKGSFERTYNRVRRILSNIRQEQALVDAYEADGWRGAAREKVKPIAEILRAKASISKYRQELRLAVKFCDEAEGDTPIPGHLFGAGGEVKEEHIFCAKCKGGDDEKGNDIVLCDGDGCNKAYHVKCVIPPIDLASMEEDEGWLCPSCDAKLDILEEINDEFGTDYDLLTSWEAVLSKDVDATPEANGETSIDRNVETLGGILGGEDLPSEDEDDADYSERSKREASHSEETSSDESSGVDSSEIGLPTPGDHDPTLRTRNPDQKGRNAAAVVPRDQAKGNNERYKMTETESPESPSALIVSSKRRRGAVDYRALHLEMFGPTDATNDIEYDQSEDEAWSPTSAQRGSNGTSGKRS